MSYARTVTGQKIAFRVKLKEMGFSSYADYLRSAHWRRIREEYVASKLSERCALCGRDEYQLHHKSYARLGRELLMDFVALCGQCHSALHRESESEGIQLSTPHAAIRSMTGMGKGKAKRTAYSSTLYGTRWIPRGLKDLRRMYCKLGKTGTTMQHERLVGGDLPNFCLMTERNASEYCRVLTGVEYNTDFNPKVADEKPANILIFDSTRPQSDKRLSFGGCLGDD